MSGLYIHIPFCKKACHYCNFHFSTTLTQLDEVLTAIMLEIALRKNEMPNSPINSIYFGGGTPSLISEAWLNKLFNQLYKNYNIASDAEVTLEANPDDVTPERLKQWKNLPVNRFSLGVQSFFDEDLALMNRAHNANEAEGCIKLIQDTGFNTISIDLMYGLPGLTNTKWMANLEKIITYQLPHLSAYCLTIEEKTALAHLTKKGTITKPDEATAAEQFELMVKFLQHNHFEQYEISNFASQGQYAKHNTAYWQNKPYLGFGPSAHSFNGQQRRWNVANNLKYVTLLKNNQDYFEFENLTLNNKMNEYIMTSTRTMWGCNLDFFEEKFGANYAEQLLQKAISLNRTDEIKIDNGVITLTQKGKLLADDIAAALFF